MGKPTEAIEAFGELDRIFKGLEDRYGLEYFCLAIYPEFRKGLSHGEKFKSFISKNRKLVARTLSYQFAITRAEAEHRLKQKVKADK